MIVGYVWQILGRGREGKEWPPPHPWVAPKKPILSRVNIDFMKQNFLNFNSASSCLFIEYLLIYIIFFDFAF